MPKKCSYPNYLGKFPEGMLEQCAIENCLNRLHHSCQTEYEHSQNIDMGLHKHWFCCCAGKIKEVSESNSRENASESNPDGRLKYDRTHNNKSPAIHLRYSVVEDAGVTNTKNLSQIIIPESKETNAFDLESNSGEKVSQIKRAGRLKLDSSYDNESPTIDLRDSTAKDASSTARKNPP